MVVAETLFGLQLVQQSCKAIKMALKTTEDVSEIAGLIDNVFRGQEQLKKKAHPIASKWGGFIKGATSDKFLEMAITETIQEKEAQKAIDRISYMLNRKFGQDTWTYILIARDEKKKRYEEAIEAKKIISKKRWTKISEIICSIIAVAVIIGGLWLFIMYAER